MTLVLTVRGRSTIWMLADRRLTAGHRVVSDDAVKLVRLESDDAKAIIGYAGLGATSAGTQPSDWMSRVFRGRRGTLEQLLGSLAAAGLAELPKHIRAGGFDHTAMAAALVDKAPLIYSVGVERSVVGNQYEMYFTRLQTAAGPRIAIAGSGAAVILAMGRVAVRPLLRLAQAYERGRISADTVSDEMAALSYRVHLTERTVGPRSIALWTDKHGTGGHTCYTGTSREASCGKVPTIARGMDVQAIADLSMRIMFADTAGMFKEHFPEIDRERMNEELRKLPTGPDEKLS